MLPSTVTDGELEAIETPEAHMRKEDARLLVGGGCYSDDVNLPGQAYTCFVEHRRDKGPLPGAPAASPVTARPGSAGSRTPRPGTASPRTLHDTPLRH